ncbi:hypothetical protein ANCCAN_13592 [Ancylostoma caninum]|uniref:Uncharacterized protein n=1 Tax=Ancylostoma caninum TaxID=29170 RepID=A0A368GB25_ANCCA|nr:hypothetical protein ANCCAN_13592 [Ancylostoma caninum]
MGTTLCGNIAVDLCPSIPIGIVFNELYAQYISRTCATLFRKADGFMRHVMRCDSSRAVDTDSESDKRSQLTPAAKVTVVPKVTRVPLKKPVANGVMSAPTSTASAISQELKKVQVVRRVGRPPNSEKAKLAQLPVKNEFTEPTPTPPVVVVASDIEPKITPAPRAQKRAYKAPKATTPQKILKTENNADNSKNAFNQFSKPMTVDDKQC